MIVLFVRHILHRPIPRHVLATGTENRKKKRLGVSFENIIRKGLPVHLDMKPVRFLRDMHRLLRLTANTERKTKYQRRQNCSVGHRRCFSSKISRHKALFLLIVTPSVAQTSESAVSQVSTCALRFSRGHSVHQQSHLLPLATCGFFTLVLASIALLSRLTGPAFSSTWIPTFCFCFSGSRVSRIILFLNTNPCVSPRTRIPATSSFTPLFSIKFSSS